MALCMIAVTDPTTIGQQIPQSNFIRFDGEELHIADWRGRRDKLKAVVAPFLTTQVIMDFAEWTSPWPPENDAAGG